MIEAEVGIETNEGVMGTFVVHPDGAGPRPVVLFLMDAPGMREEIRDIVSEIVAIKNVVMSIAEQEELLEDICNDVLGYGPLEPLLARDDIADVMINGADTTYIEVDGKTQKTSVRFADNTQLMNICQRIVSQVGRRVDESSPICDARLPDGSRVNVIAPPLSLDGPTLTIRKFKKDKLTLDQLVNFGAISPEGAEILQIIGRVRCNIVISGGTGSGKTTTLYSSIRQMDLRKLNVSTVEDPVEYNLKDITQLQTHERIGMTFSMKDAVSASKLRKQNTAPSRPAR